ncbi:MAG: HAMP domain-containing histidine kinase [Spirochaetia bacterium]|nr:HAMP domain-containing histidine kinase [Spirochaetia bacterium]
MSRTRRVKFIEGKEQMVIMLSLFFLFLLLSTLVLFLAQLFIDRETTLMQFEAERGFASSTLLLLQEEHSKALEAMGDANVKGIGVYSNNGRLRLGLGSVPNIIPLDKFNVMWRNGSDTQYINGMASYNKETGMIEYVRYSRFTIEMETGDLMLDEEGYLPSPLTFPDVLYVLFDGQEYYNKVMNVRFISGVSILSLLVLLILIFNVYQNNRKYREKLAKQEHLVNLGEAARTLAHEIKNPLSAIALQIAILKKTLPPEAKSGLSLIDQESYRLTALTDRISDFLRNPVGDPKPIEIRELIESLTKRFDTPIEIVSTSLEKAYISIDPYRARSIFENLLKNAIESSSEGDPKVTVEITKGKKKQCHIFIHDKGDGIDEASFEKIFDPFYTTKVHGSGIGLSISRQFVRARNGDLKIYNREDKGVTVEVILPLIHT